VRTVDANGDGNVSIPEFAAFMLGREDLKEELRFAPSAGEDGEGTTMLPPVVHSPRAMTAAYPTRRPRGEEPFAMPHDRDVYDHTLRWESKPVTPRERSFVMRMSSDIDTRRKIFFENELSRAEQFRGFHSPRSPRLDPLRPRFEEVTIDWTLTGMGGPAIKSHNRKKTALEPRKPFRWGQLGGWDY
jgi:hypothetical protein